MCFFSKVKKSISVCYFKFWLWTLRHANCCEVIVTFGSFCRVSAVIPRGGLLSLEATAPLNILQCFPFWIFPCFLWVIWKGPEVFFDKEEEGDTVKVAPWVACTLTLLAPSPNSWVKPSIWHNYHNNLQRIVLPQHSTPPMQAIFYVNSFHTVLPGQDDYNLARSLCWKELQFNTLLLYERL